MILNYSKWLDQPVFFHVDANKTSWLSCNKHGKTTMFLHIFTILDGFLAPDHPIFPRFFLRSRAAHAATLLRAAAAGATAVVHDGAGGFAACPGPWYSRIIIYLVYGDFGIVNI